MNALKPRKKAQARMDEFVWILLAGILIVLAVLFAWGTPSPEENATENITELKSPFTIGTETVDIPRVIRIGDFSISYTVGSEVLATSKYVEVKRGLFEDNIFSMSGKIDHNLNYVTDGWLILDILETNGGNLIVKVNNKVVYNQKTNPGRINIPVEKDLLTNYNVVEIRAGMPGLQFWSTSVYRIEKIQFGINLYGSEEKTYNFQMFGSELNSFTEGRIAFDVDEREGNGNMIIKINGRTVFNGVPSGSFSKTFELFDVGLVNGNNVITFSTEKDTTYKLDDVELIVTHKEKGEKSKSFVFTITDDDMRLLEGGRKGKIRFYILDSDLTGSLKLKIVDADGIEHDLDVIDSYAIGKTVTVNFQASDVKVGKNVVVFSVIGEGKFTLSNLEIIV